MTTNAPEETEILPELQVVELMDTLTTVLRAEDQGLWRQDVWAAETSCGTAACFAGWRAMMDGYTDLVTDDDGQSVCLVNPATGVRLMFSGPDDSSKGTIAAYAKERLGLNSGEAWELFDPDNDLNDLRDTVNDIIAYRLGLLG